VSYLVDTNVLSELRKNERADTRVKAWSESVPGREVYTSALVIGEIRTGIESVRRRDAASAIALEEWLARIVTSYGNRILPVDLRIAERWGHINVPDPLPAVDGLLVATALDHDLTLVTRDTRGLERTGVRLLDPWTAAA
jgi:hypothetical protein